MSEELNQTQIVEEFLKIVKKKLPGWLKDNKAELKDVLSELESHIWEKSEEIAGGKDIQIHHVQQAVQAMGNPRDIAAEYKKRGTPKIWISQELFPSYLKVFGIVFAVIVGVNLISFIIDAITNGFIDNQLFSYIEVVFSSALGAFLVVTIIFVALSVEGYLPEDFKKSKYKSKMKSIPSEKPIIATKKIKPPLKRGQLLAGGIIALLIGSAMYFEVWVNMPALDYLGIDLLEWLRIAGFFLIIGGLINLVQSMVDLTNYTLQRVLIIIYIIKDIAFIPIILRLRFAILEVPSIVGLDPGLISTIDLAFKVITGIAIFGTVVGSLSNIYKAITLKMKFEEYHQYQEM